MRINASKAAWVRALLMGALGLAYSEAHAVGCMSTANVPSNYATIQAGVNAATSPLTGDHCVIVDNGTYAEQVVIATWNTSGYRIIISSAPGANVVISPPAASTAAFIIQNASVTLFGLNIVGANPMPYAITVSSPEVRIENVTVAGGTFINTGGVIIKASRTTIEKSSVSVQAASNFDAAVFIDVGMSSNAIINSYISNHVGYGAFIRGSANTIDLSTITNNTGSWAAVLIMGPGAGQNIISLSSITNRSGVGLQLQNSNGNTISVSTVTNGGSWAIDIVNSHSNTLVNNRIAPVAAGVSLNTGSKFNYLSSNTIITSVFSGSAALALNDASSNTITRSYISAPLGEGLNFFANANSNSVSFSTITGGTGYCGLQIDDSTFNVITNAYIINNGGDAARILSGADSNKIFFSTIVAPVSGNALVVTGASSGTVANSWLRSAAARGLKLSGAHYNTVDRSTIAGAAIGVGAEALFVQQSSWNLITRSYITNPGGWAAVLDSAISNTVSHSTITNGVNGNSALKVINSSFNDFLNDFIQSDLDDAADIGPGSHDNLIDQSTIVTHGLDYNALFITGSDLNLVSGSYLEAPSGYPATLDNSRWTQILSSTLSSNGLNTSAVWIENGLDSRVENSVMRASTGAFILGSTGTRVSGNGISVTSSDGKGIWVTGGVMNPDLSSNTINTGPNGYGIFLEAGNVGQISLNNNSISGPRFGLNIKSQGGSPVIAINGLNLSGLSSGATGINFLSGTFVSTFNAVNFADGSIAVNVNGQSLGGGSSIMMTGASGPRAGQTFETDPGNFIHWPPFPQTRIWSYGGGSIDASLPGNWLGGQVPQNGDFVIFGGTTPNAGCTWNLPISLGSLSLQDGYTSLVTVSTNLIVNGPIHLNGAPSSSWLIFGPNSGSSQVNGQVNIYTGNLEVERSTVVFNSSVTLQGGFLTIHDNALIKGTTIFVNGAGAVSLGNSLGYGPPTLTGTDPFNRLSLKFIGTTYISTAVFQRLDEKGLQLGTSINVFSSMTFQGPLLPGSTAINFISAGTLISTFTKIDFADPNISVNINASQLNPASRIKMAFPTGPRTGPAFSNDPNFVIDWSTPPAGGGPQVFITGLNLAQPSVGSNANDVPMLRLGFWTQGGGTNLNQLIVSLTGDAPAPYITGKLYKDNDNDGTFQSTNAFLASMVFAVGSPPQVNFTGLNEPLGSTTQYFFLAMNTSGVPAGKRVGMMIEEPFDIFLASAAMASQSYPVQSTQSLVALVLHARPSDGGFPYPSATSGGLNTGTNLNANQSVVITASGTWFVSASSQVGPAGVSPVSNGGIAGVNMGALIGRIGEGSSWFLIGASGTFVAANSGNLYLAMNDSNYDDGNSGFLDIGIEVLASTVTKVWTGSFSQAADVDSNWIGGKPNNGDRVLFDHAVSTRDCSWNYSANIQLLTLTTGYTGTIYLDGPGAGSVFLNVSSAVVIGSGTIRLGEYAWLEAGTQIKINGGMLDLGNEWNHVRVGKSGIHVNGGSLRSAGYNQVWIEALNSFDRFPILGEFGSIDLNNAVVTQIDATSGLELSSSVAVTNLRRVRFWDFNPNPNAAIALESVSPITRTFESIEFNMHYSTNVDASGLASGSNITMLNASGPKMGSPYEKDPNNVVTWSPDGGASAQISGVLTNSGTGSGNYTIRVTTGPIPSPFGPCMPPGTTGASCIEVSTPATGGYLISGLPAPNTWYVTAWRNSGGFPFDYHPRGGYNSPAGFFRSSPIFLSSGSAPSNINVTLKDWGRISGNINKTSSQTGPIRVQAYTNALPPTVGAILEAELANTLPSGGGFYDLAVPATSLYILGFVDVNGSGAPDSFEASGSSSVILGVANANHGGADFTIAGGSSAPGGLLTVSAASIHGGAIGSSFQNGMLRLDLTGSGADATLTALRFDVTGAVPLMNYSVALFKDSNSNGVLDNAAGNFDTQVAHQSMSGGVSSGTLNLWQPETIANGQTKRFFLAIDLFNQQNPPVGLSIGASTYFGLSQGAMDSQAVYPIDSGLANVRFKVQADWGAQYNSGGQYTNFFVPMGLQLTINATGTWSNNQTVTTPAGIAGTEFQGTILPHARRGELIARIGGGGTTGGSGWFRVGTGTVITSNFSGDLFMAMNDYENDHWNNSGSVFVDFFVGGSTTGAISGAVSYKGAVNTGNLRINAIQWFCETCFNNVVATTTVAMSGGTPVSGGREYGYIMGGLPGGNYVLQATVENVPTQTGRTFSPVSLTAGSTTTGVNFAVALGTGAISGVLSYSGFQNYGNFLIAAATHTDFSRNPVLFGNLSQPSSGAFSMTGLPTPNTFYIVAFRDGNWNMRPDGPEPFGVHGNSSGAVSNLSSLFTPVFVDTNTSVGGKNVFLQDRGAISGQINVSTGLSSVELVVRVGRGTPGSPNYQVENEDAQFVFNLPQHTFQYYNVGLLRGATDYSVLAFADANFNHQHDPGEFFGQANGPFTVNPGGFTNVDFSLSGPQIPPAPTSFNGVALSTFQVKWSWNASPGASGYQLRTATGGVVHMAGTGAVQYIEPRGANQASLITTIAAVNSVGTSAVVTAPLIPVYSFAEQPGTPGFTNVGESSVSLNWSGFGNPANTVYEVARATDAVLYLISSVSTSNPRVELGLAPSTPYDFKVRAVNGNGIATAFSGAGSMVTSAAVAPSIRGLLQYFGRQSGTMYVQAFTTYPFSGGAAAQTFFPASPAYNYYVGVPSGQTYFLRTFVDVNNDAVLNAGEDFGHFQYSTMAAAGTFVGGPVSGKDFTLPHDTLRPASPTGLTGNTTIGRVTLNWTAPARNADNTTIFDLSSYRVQRSTNASGPFVVISSLTVRGATGTVAGTTFTDFSPVAGFTNYYRVIALDYGQNESLPSGSFAVSPAVGGRINGTINYVGSTSDGAFRVRLSSLAAPGAPFLAEHTVSPFSFTGLQDGTYFLRGFRDLNGDNSQDGAVEPSGTYGGISAPFPIQIYNGNVVSSATVTICDRTALNPGSPVTGASLASSDCRALDQGPDYYTDIYTFRVGGGGANSIGVGSTIELRMFGYAFDTRMFLLGPDGFVLAQDQRPGASYITYTVNQPGLYRVEPTSFFSFTTGSYDLSLSVTGGFSGSISGTISYGGSQSGSVYVQLFNTPDASAFPVRVSSMPAPGAFAVAGLPDGTYFLRGFRDANGNGIKDPGEAAGQYGVSASSLSAISVIGGVSNVGSIAVTLTDPPVGYVSGQILREGTQAGTIRVEIGARKCEGCSELDVVAFATMTAAGPYTLPFISPATNYILKSYVDQNLNFRDDPLEAKASSSPVTVQANSTTTVNLLVRDPGTGSSGNATITGTVDYQGASTGPMLMAFATDGDFSYIAYLHSQGSTGTYTKTGILGGTSYYIAAFIDVNNNGQPDEQTQGEPVGFYNSGAPLFAPQSGSITANLTIEDGPTGRIRGRVSYSGFASGPIMVRAEKQCSGGSCSNQDHTSQTQVIERTFGVSDYDFDLPFLAAATNYNVSAFIDSNRNRGTDFGEPFAQFGQGACSGFGPCYGAPVSVSSGANTFPTYGVNITIQDQGQNTGNFNNMGRISGDVGYLGTAGGPIIVRFFDNQTYTGVPLHTITLAMPPGSGFMNFAKEGLSFGTYCVDAFRDTSGFGYYNPSYHPHTEFGCVTLTQSNNNKNVNGDPMVDLGQGGSVNVYSGNFAAPGGARFDGGATDLAINMAIDTVTTNGPFIYVQGITHQNGNSILMSLVKYSSAGVFIASGTVGGGNMARLVVGPSQRLFLGGSTPYNNYASTAAWYEYNTTTLKVISTRTINDSDVISGMAHYEGSLLVLVGCGPHQGRLLRKIDPNTGVVTATGTYIFPGSAASLDAGCGGSAAVNPVNGDVYALVHSGGGDTFGKVAALLKFGPNLDSSGAPLVRDVTNLGLGDVDGSLAVDGAGNLYVGFIGQGTSGSVAKIYKFNSSLAEQANVSYPIFSHFDAGLGNLQLGPDGTVYAVFESTMNGGDYMMLRYDANLSGLLAWRTFDGGAGTQEDFGSSMGVLDASNVFITGTVNNGQNLDWATIKVNMTGSGSSSGAGTTVVITSNTATNAIIANLRYSGTLITSGTIRSLLLPAGSDIPVRRASAAFTTASHQHIFNSLGGGEYLLQAFVDPNNNLVPDAGEPVFYSASTISYSGAGNFFMPEGQLCDRRPITAGVDVNDSFVAADCRGPRNAFHRLYNFQGTRGQVVTIELTATGFYDTFLNLLSPKGHSLIKDDESAGGGNARISNFVLPEDGLYTIAASPFAADIMGGFRLSLSGSAGSLGSISGNITYSGSQGGKMVTGIFNSTTFNDSTLVQVNELPGPGAYSFTSLRTPATYYIAAFIDANYNHHPDPGEDSGQFGNPIAAIELRSGQDLSGLDFEISGSSGAAGEASVSGVISYGGSRSGPLKIEFWSNAAMTGQPIGLRTIPTGVGAYDITIPGGQPYYIRAYLDVSNDHILQLGSEPSGIYAPRGQGAEPIYPPVSGSVTGINLEIRDPEQRAIQGGGTSAVGEGRAYISSAGLGGLFGGSAPVGAGAFVSSVTVKVFLGANGLRLGGGVSFGPPQGVFANNVTVTVTSTNTFTTFTENLYPNTILRLMTGDLNAGDTVQFTMHGAFVPCVQGSYPFVIATAQGSGSSANPVPPAPLFNGSPSLSVQAGAAQFFQLTEGYVTLTQNAVSDALTIEAKDNCGNAVPVSGAKTVELRSKTYDFGSGNYISDATLGFSTAATAASFASPHTVTVANGESRGTFYAKATSVGFKNVEMFFNLTAPTTFYAAMNVLAGNTLSNVSVSTVPYQLGRTSATIVPNSDPTTPNQAYINFDVSDPMVNWRVLISSTPYKSGVVPVALWETWGFGQPTRGQVAWDGRYSPWINFGGRVPSGNYYVRVEVGAGLRDDSLRITVISPQLTGTVADSGTTPNLPLPGVTVRAFGPFGGGSAVTDSRGAFALPGLSAGVYQLNFEKPNYLFGSAQAAINSSGLASTATASNSSISISTTSAGALKVLMGRAPTLVVIPSLSVSESTKSFDQWGNITVRNADYSRFFTSGIRLPAGTTTFDDGGRWDPSVQQFVAKQYLSFDVAIDTYVVEANFVGYDASTASVYVPAGLTEARLSPFSRRPSIAGAVRLPSAGLNTSGYFVYLNAIPSTATVAASSGAVGEAYGSVFLPPGTSSAAYRIDNVRNGIYTLRANAQGLGQVSTGPVTVAGSDLTGVDFPTFADPTASNVITGTVTINANTSGFQPLGAGQPRLRMHLHAWSPQSPNFGNATVVLSTHASQSVQNFTILGLSPGVEYQIFAYLEHNSGTEFESPGGFPKRATINPATGKNPEGSLQFSFGASSGVISGTILLPSGSVDFTNVDLYGQTVASARPEEVGKTFSVIQSTNLPGFKCGDGSAPNASGNCVGVSTATFKVDGLNTQTVDVTLIYRTTGRTWKGRVPVVNGSTTTVTVDLRGSTFAISGVILNQIANDLFNTNAKIFANAPYVPILDERGNPVPGLSSSTARVLAIKQELSEFSTAISTSFKPAVDRVAFLDAAGNYSITNLPSGVYFVRTSDLRSCATCSILIPRTGALVRLSTGSIGGVNLTLSDGYNVSGTVYLAGEAKDAIGVRLSVYNKRQELVRSQTINVGDNAEPANSSAYQFNSLPRGEFYTLVASVLPGSDGLAKYAGRPIRFPNPVLSPSGLSSSLAGQDMTLERSAYITGRLKEANSGVLIGANNAALLPPNFEINATANPWVEGGFVVAAASVSNRPILADDTFRVGPLIPGLYYDLRLQQTRWDLAFLAQGSQNYAPITLGGLNPQAGEVLDVGVLSLNQGQSLSGKITDAATGAGLGSIKVTAKPSYSDALEVQTYSDPQGAYTIWVSTFVSNQFDITAAPRDGNTASNGKVYKEATFKGVNVVTVSSVDFKLGQLIGSVTGQIATEDQGELSYPFGELKGFPAAAVFLQPRGVVPVNNPLGDLEEHTDESGLFEIPGLATGTYQLRAVSLGYIVFDATVTVSPVSSGVSTFCIFVGTETNSCRQTLTLKKGAVVTGRIDKPDPTSDTGFVSPNEDEVGSIAAANASFTKFVIGTVEVDPNARTINSYTISGFEVGEVYDLFILPKDGSEMSFPTEGNDVSFTAEESTTTKTINLTYTPTGAVCAATQKTLGNSQYQVKIDCTKPLRNQTAADNDLSLILTISTQTSKGAAIASTGQLLGGDKKISEDRRQITAIYRAGAGETQFSLKLAGYTANVDPTTGSEFPINFIFDFFTGLDAKKSNSISNITGGCVELEPSQEDELLGLNESSSICLEGGSIQNNDLTPAASAQLTLQKAKTKGQAEAQYMKSLGYVPLATSIKDNPSAYPKDIYDAMQAMKPLANTFNPMSAFYDIFLPAGIRNQLKKKANITLSYSLSGSTGTKLENINVWHFVGGKWVLEARDRQIDPVNQTITVSVDSFSAFVVLASTPVATISGFNGNQIEAYNFPNPADCITHTLTLSTATGVGQGQTIFGTMIRAALPAGQTSNLNIKIFNTAGELVRSMDQGAVAGGLHHYIPWDCKNDGGNTVSSGVYFGQVEWGGSRKLFKMAIIKGSGL